MAKKYIDAEKLERHFENCICEAYNTNGVTEDFEIALKATKNQPAADVQEVKHGKWEVSNIEYGYNNAVIPVEWECSLCGSAFEDRYLYCPHCGAKMDGDSNDN